MINEARFLARRDCARCFGQGVVYTAFDDVARTCRCVNRAVFSAVWDQYNEITSGDRRASLVYCHESYGCSRPMEEFAADVRIVARRAMTNARLLDILNHWFFGIGAEHSFSDSVRSRLMAVYCMRESSWRADVDSIKILAGSAFETTKPQSIYPVRQYLHEHHWADNTPFPPFDLAERRPALRAPIRPNIPSRGKKAA